ncbi:MAG: hypothetical protein JWR62_2442 [Modestobacter sp.]|nr:hypothetical protein [Modestobacter sp.]
METAARAHLFPGTVGTDLPAAAVTLGAPDRHVAVNRSAATRLDPTVRRSAGGHRFA